METVRINYLKHIIFLDVYATENQNFFVEAQIAGPSGFMSTNVVGIFNTALLATEFATHWAKRWVDSGCSEKALADAFKKLRTKAIVTARS